MPPLLSVTQLNIEFLAKSNGRASSSDAAKQETSARALLAVRDLTFSITAGEVLGLVGESGSGKSITSLAIMRLLPPQARVTGEIQFTSAANASQLNLTTISDESMRLLRGSQIAMIFQEPMTALNPVMRVGDQIAEAVLAHHSITKIEARQRAVDAMNDVAIPDPARRARDYPHQLSGGMRQRIMIAMAIVNRPRLLIADEPTTALDVTVQAQIIALLKRLRSEHGLSMLFISHDLAVVGQIADRILVMRHGRIVEQGTTHQVLTAPQHDYTRQLLSSVPSMRTPRNTPLATLAAVK